MNVPVWRSTDVPGRWLIRIPDPWADAVVALSESGEWSGSVVWDAIAEGVQCVYGSHCRYLWDLTGAVQAVTGFEGSGFWAVETFDTELGRIMGGAGGVVGMKSIAERGLSYVGFQAAEKGSNRHGWCWRCYPGVRK